MEFRRRKKEKGRERNCFLRNGSMFLEKLIADCNGISNPIRMFSSGQIFKATNHFDPECSLPDASSSFILYKGVLEGRSYTIKRFIDEWHEDEPYNDIALSARVSDHNGFVKLIGSCLELSLPVVVFEDLDYTFLNARGTVGCEDAPLLPWNARLKIAKEVATAITYLHTAFSRIIIHRNIKPANVLLDKNGTSKLTDLSHGITLPEGKSWIEDEVIGTNGYIDTDYYMTSLVTEYADVFSFGIFMLVLLTGKSPNTAIPTDTDEPNWDFLINVRDMQKRGENVEFGGDSNDMNPVQMKMFLELALRCCEKKKENRPKMIMVAKEIKLIGKESFD